MSNSLSLQNLNLFDDFVQHWFQIIGHDIFVLSLEGEIITQSNGATSPNWTEIIKQFSSYQPTFLTSAGQTILTVPLFDGHHSRGYLVALNITEQDVPLLTWGVENLTARMLETEALQGMTDELIGAWEQLELIYRVTQNLTLTPDLISTLRSILHEIRQVVNTEDGFVLVRRPGAFYCVTCNIHNLEPYLCSAIILDNLVKANHVFLGNELSSCQQIWPEAPALIDTLLATHLVITDEECEAALGLVNKINKNFTAGDAKLLTALAQQVGTIIKNFLVHERLVIEERLSRELEIAAEIQESLLPTELPKMEGLSIAVGSITASEVGGDFYDFITIDDHQLTIIVGDVAGKGIPAAMLTSVTRTMLRVEAMRDEPPHTIIHRANNILHEDLSRADSFVTVFVATLNTAEGTLSYASAGHSPAILWRVETQTTEQLKATSPPIGIFGYRGESTRTITLQPGDTLVFYTDGITEAQSPDEEFFGLRRLTQIVKEKASESPEALRAYIQAEVANFCRDSLTSDDATLLIVKLLPSTEVSIPGHSSNIIKTVDFAYPADTKYLIDISKEIVNLCRQVPALPPGSGANDFIYLIELAISEICTNIIQHAYSDQKGRITGHITVLDDGVLLDFYDTGQSFDPAAIPEPKADPHHLIEGGYGLHIVRQIMDIVVYEQDSVKGNHWHLGKFVRGSSL